MNKEVHFEIPFDDQPRAQKFYQDVFGWQINKFGDMDYWMAMTCKCDQNSMMPTEPGAINCGLLKRDPTGEHPVLVIDVPNVDDHIRKIKGASGKLIMPKMQVGDFGLYARVKDTEGNVIGIWQTIKK